MKKSQKYRQGRCLSVWLSILILMVVILSSTIKKSTAAYIDLYANADAFVTNELPDYNFGNDAVFAVGIACNPYRPYYSFIRFDFGQLPDNAIIDSAHLKLYTVVREGNFDIRAYRIVTFWEEDEITYNNQPTIDWGVVWGSTTVSPDGYLTSIDITNLVKYEWNNGYSPYGIYLSPVADCGDSAVFASRENSIYQSPFLRINYSLPKPTITMNAATSITPTSATLNAVVNPNGSQTTYFFEWGTTTNYGHQTSTLSAGSGTSGVPVSANLTNLTPNTTYHYRLVASNAGGTTYGSDVDFTTSPLPTYTLTVSKSGNGSVTSSPSGINCGSDCSENYTQGTVVTLTATPANGWSFSGWSGACSGTGTCQVTMNSNKSVTATFTQNIYTLTVSINGNGTVTANGINCPGDCSEDYIEGTTVTLTATPANGWSFSGWSGACSGTGTCQVTMNSNKSVSATFTLTPQPDITVFPTTASFGNLNIGSNSERTITVSNNGNANLTIGSITDPASPFSKVADNCTAQTLSPSASCTITIRFSPTSADTFNSSFNIPSNDPDEDPVTVTLIGTGTDVGGPDIAIYPSTYLNFPNISVGVTADQTITVKNEGNTALNIYNITSPSAPFSIVADQCSDFTLLENQSCSVTVRFAPATSGNFTSSFDIPSNDPDENLVTISLSGSATPIPNNPPTKPMLLDPPNGSTNMPTTLTLAWNPSEDPDGDTVIYKLYLSVDPSFHDTQPIVVASLPLKKDYINYAGINQGIGSLLFAIVAIGIIIKGKRKTWLWMLLIIVALFISCGGGGSGRDDGVNPPPPGSKTYTVSGLDTNTTYYWKVVADDGKGGTSESDTYTFTTRQ